MPKKLDRHHVSRAERKRIRAQEREFPPLSKGVTTLLDLNSLKAVPRRDHRQRPYEWRVFKSTTKVKTHTHPLFSMPWDASPSDWHERVTNPDSWNVRAWMGLDWSKINQQMNRLSGKIRQYTIIHDEITEVDFEKIEARVAAHAEQKAGIQSTLLERLESLQAGKKDGHE